MHQNDSNGISRWFQEDASVRWTSVQNRTTRLQFRSYDVAARALHRLLGVGERANAAQPSRKGEEEKMDRKEEVETAPRTERERSEEEAVVTQALRRDTLFFIPGLGVIRGHREALAACEG